jgi:NodT family efflux transporter outer membrane factor (OMF) lipoprotein
MKRIVLLSCLVNLAACSIGPEYVRPEFVAPKEWKSALTDSSVLWQVATPQAGHPKEKWWEMYQSQSLNALEEQCLERNQNLAIALTRIDQANASLQTRAAAQLPVVQLGALANDTKISANRPLASYGVPNQTTTQYDFKPFVQVTYEFDWLGKIRRDVEAAKAGVEQSTDDFENVKLVLTAQLAQLYFAILQSDEELAILERVSVLQSQSLQILKARHESGLAIATDLDLQNSTLQVTRSQIAILKGTRRMQENALATLVGVPAAGFQFIGGAMPTQFPRLPKVLPSELLERRPDIASAERAMFAANSLIGVAKAAYYPSLVLAPTYVGYEATAVDALFNVPALIWSLGLQATQTIFDGGRLQGGVSFAKASYQAAVASYRQTILSAFEETQNALGNIEQLQLAIAAQEQALASQNRGLKISEQRYGAGLDNIILKLSAEQTQLSIARTLAQYRGQQFINSVGLVKALGGGWQNIKSNCMPTVDCPKGQK